YASDTATGSSGGPCFSDKWQVVAIHRRGVPQTKEDNEDLIQLRSGDFLTREQINQLRIPESDILWLANEGIRVSVFVNKIKSDPISSNNLFIADWLLKLGPNEFNQNSNFDFFENNSPLLFIENRRPKNDYEKRNGFQEDFLEIAIPKPTFERAKQLWGDLSYNSDTGKSELPYYNYSIWMNKPRRMALVSAVNIDGKSHNERYRKEFGDDKWVYDDRLPERLQIGNWFYTNEPARYNKNYFDRGHVTRRTEPCWGNDEIAKLANDDTFHWTNCSPQYKDFNQRSYHWQGLEQFLLDNGCVKNKIKMTIFSGPIFSNEDTEHRGVLIPKLFFKIGIYVDGQGNLRSAGYVLDQSKWVDVIDFEKARVLDIPKSRRSISWIESKTGIDFGNLVREADEAFNLNDNLNEIEQLPDFFDHISIPIS
ncbi:MAG: DNA/RNA non-specific endonuclease, partial [Gelidibacter sp.]|nr:DNA/RNA non-specific endonuclease [Gelidibacter sp.]